MSKGLDVQKSRFAALYLDPDSCSDDDDSLWQQAPVKYKVSTKKVPHQSHQQPQEEGGKTTSKNAKKRARKRRNKSASSDEVSFSRHRDKTAACW